MNNQENLKKIEGEILDKVNWAECQVDTQHPDEYFDNLKEDIKDVFKNHNPHQEEKPVIGEGSISEDENLTLKGKDALGEKYPRPPADVSNKEKGCDEE